MNIRQINMKGLMIKGTKGFYSWVGEGLSLVERKGWRKGGRLKKRGMRMVGGLKVKR